MEGRLNGGKGGQASVHGGAGKGGCAPGRGILMSKGAVRQGRGAKREKGGEDSKGRERRDFGASKELGSSSVGYIMPPLYVSNFSPVQQDHPLPLSTNVVLRDGLVAELVKSSLKRAS